MAFELWVAAGVGAMLLFTWSVLATSFALVERVSADGVLLRLLYGKKMFRWTDFRGRAKRFESFMPRLVLERSERSFLSLHTAYSILLRGRPAEAELIKEIETRFGIDDVRTLRDLTRRSE